MERDILLFKGSDQGQDLGEVLDLSLVESSKTRKQLHICDVLRWLPFYNSFDLGRIHFYAISS
jgi:hypothetical protein